MFSDAFWVSALIQSSVLIVIVFSVVRKHYWVALAASAFYLPLLPVSRLFDNTAFGAHLSDRYLYMPLFGLVMGVVGAVKAVQSIL